MKVLIVGSGGREHAIATSVAKSDKVSKIYCAPGNAGIGQIAECVPIGAMEFDKIVAFAKEKGVEPNSEQLAKSKPLLVRLVNAYIVRNILNDEGFFPLYERDDDVTKAAIKVLTSPQL